MTLHFYNTLSRSVERFEPLVPGRVCMYTCGPTVYERAHVGNFRTFVWEDLLRRFLRWSGYEVTQVMNLTDVDDRTIQAASTRGATLADVTEPVIEAFFEDWNRLGLEPVEHNPRATEHVPQMIALIRTLEEKGLTYESDGSVYFAIRRFAGYGVLANLDPSDLETAGRATGDEEYAKDDPRDFVLWKGGRTEEGAVATWDSPWGPGRPGWHLECSAMAMEYLGRTLDIHTGGVDNIFPHHTNEAAQSEGATGQRFARYWLHAAHLLVDGSKMSKSLGNYYTIPDLTELGYRPSAIRYLLLTGHYRSQLNFTLEGLADAERALQRLEEFEDRLADPGGPAGDPVDTDLNEEAGGQAEQADDQTDGIVDLAARTRAEFAAALEDDLNVSEALAAVFSMVREANQDLDRGALSATESRHLRGVMSDFDAVFGVLPLRRKERAEAADRLGPWIEGLIADRQAARKAGDYEQADRIRNELEERGIILEDTPAGTRWKLGEIRGAGG
jgi:cysteinyl-tRNA synthetase